MNKSKAIFLVAGSLLIMAAVVSVFIGEGKKVSEPSLGSVTQGNEYYSTTTPNCAAGCTWSDQLLKNGSGTLGSVIITDTGTVKFTLYDATSTGSLTTGNFDQTQRRLAEIGASLAAGTYTFDTSFKYGLLLDYKSGTTGTTTITFR